MGLMNFFKKDKNDNCKPVIAENPSQMELKPINSFLVKLLYKDKPVIDYDKLLSELKMKCGQVDIITKSPEENLFSVVFLETV